MKTAARAGKLLLDDLARIVTYPLKKAFEITVVGNLSHNLKSELLKRDCFREDSLDRMFITSLPPDPRYPLDVSGLELPVISKKSVVTFASTFTNMVLYYYGAQLLNDSGITQIERLPDMALAYSIFEGTIRGAWSLLSVRTYKDTDSYGYTSERLMLGTAHYPGSLPGVILSGAITYFRNLHFRAKVHLD